jgi:hypothetical protein
MSAVTPFYMSGRSAVRRIHSVGWHPEESEHFVPDLACAYCQLTTFGCAKDTYAC